MPAALSPIPGACPPMGGSYDGASRGYTEQEFLLSGTAASYAMTGERTPDG